MISLGVSLSNDSPHCAFIHTAMGAAAGSDVVIDDLQRFYQTGDPEAGFPASAGQDPLVRKMASWTIKHRDREERERFIPCTVRAAHSTSLMRFPGTRFLTVLRVTPSL